MAYSIDDVITLIKETPTGEYDELGQELTAETSRVVFCKVTSASRSEYYQARQTGLEPEFVFTLQPTNYDGERVLEYGTDAQGDPQRYAIYRTYRPEADKLELYVHKKVGTL